MSHVYYGFYEYQAIWGTIELLQRLNNSYTVVDPYAVSVMKGREVVGHVMSAL